MKIHRTFLEKVSRWFGMARWWLARGVMGEKQANKVKYHFQFWREAKATLRGPTFNRLERNAGYWVREEKKRRG